MNRINTVINYISRYIHKDDHKTLRHFYLMHMHGVSQFAVMLALKRNLDPELAAIAGLLHDIHTLDTMDSTKHAKKGAVLAREILSELKITDEVETGIICNTIYHHSAKKKIHDKYDELLKDADVLSHCLHNPTNEPFPKDVERFKQLTKELGLNNPYNTDDEV